MKIQNETILDELERVFWGQNIRFSLRNYSIKNIYLIERKSHMENILFQIQRKWKEKEEEKYEY